MAEIHVEERGPGVWPWIVGLMILAVMVWAVAELVGGDSGIVVGPPAEAVEGAP